ncbi:plasmid mobilization relaxosome protein MobC [Pseudoflavonifractor intestinihominis]
MSKKTKRKTILIDGIRYYADKPDTCRKCFFWKNRKVGCILGKQNCYYLAEAAMTAQEMISLLRYCSNNLNQYAKRANENGSIYAEDIRDLQSRQNEIWEIAKEILARLATIQ